MDQLNRIKQFFNASQIQHTFTNIRKNLKYQILTGIFFIIFSTIFIWTSLNNTVTKLDKNLFSLSSERISQFSKGDTINKEDHRRKISFAAEVIWSFRKSMLFFGISFSLIVVLLLLVFQLFLSAISFTTQTVFFFRGIDEKAESVPRTKKAIKYLFVFGALLTTVGLIIMFANFRKFNLKIHGPLVLWAVSFIFLLYYSISFIEVYRSIRSNIGEKTRQYILLKGSEHALTGIIALWFLIYTANFLPQYAFDRLNMVQIEVVGVAAKQATLSFTQSERQKAINAVSEGLDVLNFYTLREKISGMIKPMVSHSIKIALLAWYVFLAVPFCGLRFRRPHLSFWIGGGLLGLFMFLFNLITENLLIDYINQTDIKFLLALTGVGVGFYLAFLIRPLMHE